MSKQGPQTETWIAHEWVGGSFDPCRKAGRAGPNTGFTLIEVLVTIVILAIGVLALAGLQILSIKNSSFNRAATGATVAAQKKMEDLKSTAFTAIAAGTSTLSIANGDQTDGVMTWTVSTLPVGAVPPNRYKDIVLDVCFACTTVCASCDATCTSCKKTELRTMVSE